MTNESKAEVIHRLRSADGHLHGVIKMVEAERPCDEILQQLYAVCSALRAIGFVFGKQQLDHSMDIIRGSKCIEQPRSEIIRMVDIYQ